MTTATRAWKTALTVIINGQDVSPRGQPTREVQHHTFICDMGAPVVWSDARALSYKFMAAEALWILAGDNSVAGIAPYNQRIAEFSDDGVTFFGAYGPRIIAQLDYVVEALVRDRETRQAVLTTWRPCPPTTKDVPCTVAMAFMIRDDRLNCHVFMRSSDAWLGLPYDCFNFSMVAARIACLYNVHGLPPIALGTLYLTAASAHLYAKNFNDARRCIIEPDFNGVSPHDGLRRLVALNNWQAIEDSLIACRDNHSSQWSQAWMIRPIMNQS